MAGDWPSGCSPRAAWSFAVGGHRLTVTHADGFPVEPVIVDTLIIGMGERYDVVVTAGDGVFPVVAIPAGKPDPAGFALLRTATDARPPANAARPVALDRQRLEYAMLQATAAAALSAPEPDRELAMTLSMAAGGRRRPAVAGERHELRRERSATPAQRRAGATGRRQPVDDVPLHAPARAHVRGQRSGPTGVSQ